MSSQNSINKLDILFHELKLNSNDKKKEFVEKFAGSVRSLLEKKENEPEYFREFRSERLLNLLFELNIKKNELPSDEELAKVDTVIVLSGQLITLVENRLTFEHLKDKFQSKEVLIFPMNMMAKFPTTDQIKICHDLLHPEGEKEISIPKKWAFDIWTPYIRSKRIDGKNDTQHVEKFLPCVNGDDLMPLVFELISCDLSDRPHDILIITSQPKETERNFNNYFANKNYPHKFLFAKYTTPEFEAKKTEYFGEDIGVTVRFLLRDLAEELKE